MHPPPTSSLYSFSILQSLPIPGLTAHDTIYQIYVFALHFVTFRFPYNRFNHPVPAEPLTPSSFEDYSKHVSVFGQAMTSHINKSPCLF